MPRTIRLLVTLLAVLLWSAPAHAAFSRLGLSSGTGSVTVNTTGATFIVVLTGGDATTFTENKNSSASYTAYTQRTSGNGELVKAYAMASPTVGASHTFTAAQTYDVIGVWWGTGQASPFSDVENGAGDATNNTSIQPGSITPTQDSDLVLVGLVTGAGNSSTYTISGGGFSTIATHIDGATGVTYGFAAAELIQTTATATNPTVGWTTIARSTVAIVSFKASGGSPPPTATPCTMSLLGVGKCDE